MDAINPALLCAESFKSRRRAPEFENLLKVLNRKKPSRPVLFEFFLNDRLYKSLSGIADWPGADDWSKAAIGAYAAAGYDYATVQGCSLDFPSLQRGEKGKKTVSLNEGAVITDRESFSRYPWPDPDGLDYSRLSRLAPLLPDGMKFVVWGGSCGVLETVIKLVGYERLCYMLCDDEGLAGDIFGEVGARILRSYEICAKVSSAGALISNDDWGFNTQTMLSPEDMRRYVFPWHKKIVKTIHAAGKPAILHSCGNLDAVMDDVIGDMGFDGKHSYEDTFMPVETAYEKYGGKIAVLGGVDVDFLCRSSPERIFDRSRAMLEKSSKRGGYALGSGNSIPYYVPDESYFAMILAAREDLYE